MSVQIYKDGKLTPVAGELYESGNVVPLANHANTANTANRADSANRALTDGRGYEISRTYMPRGIDFKAGPFHTFRSGSWTATEDCFMCAQTGSVSGRYSTIKVDDVVIFSGGNNTNAANTSEITTLPIIKGQVIYFKYGSDFHKNVGAKFYRYIY